MSSKETDVEVLIIGAGPVGLAAALQLGRAGHKTLIVERRPSLTRHPKAMGAHPRTLELFRGWGISEAAYAVSLPMERTLGFGWMTSINDGIEMGQIMFADEMERLIEYSRDSPERNCMVSQTLLEPVIFEGMSAQDDVTIRFDTTATILEQDDDGVTATLTSEDGKEETVRAQYVIAADGAHSPTRKGLGITETSSPPFGETVSVYFKSSDMERYMAGRPYLLWWVINDKVQGGFWPVNLDEQTYMLGFAGDMSEADAHFDADYCAGLVKAGVGDQDMDLEILEIARWAHQEAVADSWREGRVFLAGDAAHRFPPHGGFGMNSGIQDTGNLIWKLDAVLKGWASDALLDTYEPERKPVAKTNATQCVLNTVKMEETGWLVDDPATVFADIAKPEEGEAVRKGISDSIPKQRDQLWHQGQQFGYIYSSDAVIDDGTEAEQSTVSEYKSTGHPGARAPHLWVKNAKNEHRSTIDLFVDQFAVLTGAAGRDWVAAAEAVAADRNLPISAYVIGEDLVPIEGSFEESYGIEPTGAVVVRPDGHVMMRCATAPADCKAALEAAFDSVLASERASA
jgi:putative polyketide hydroxylase